MNNSIFANTVHERFSIFMEDKDNRQTKFGTLGEDLLEEELIKNPNVKKVERSMSTHKHVRVDGEIKKFRTKGVPIINQDVDILFNIDVKVTLNNEEVIWVPVVRDMWRSTAQNDRLASTYYKCKFNTFGKNNVKFFFIEDIHNFLINSPNRTWKQKQINTIIKELWVQSNIVNIEELNEFIDELSANE